MHRLASSSPAGRQADRDRDRDHQDRGRGGGSPPHAQIAPRVLNLASNFIGVPVHKGVLMAAADPTYVTLLQQAVIEKSTMACLRCLFSVNYGDIDMAAALPHGKCGGLWRGAILAENDVASMVVVPAKRWATLVAIMAQCVNGAPNEIVAEGVPMLIWNAAESLMDDDVKFGAWAEAEFEKVARGAGRSRSRDRSPGSANGRNQGQPGGRSRDVVPLARGAARPRSSDRTGSTASERDRERERERDRVREREREQDRERDRERARERDRQHDEREREARSASRSGQVSDDDQAAGFRRLSIGDAVPTTASPASLRRGTPEEERLKRLQLLVIDLDSFKAFVTLATNSLATPGERQSHMLCALKAQQRSGFIEKCAGNASEDVLLELLDSEDDADDTRRSLFELVCLREGKSVEDDDAFIRHYEEVTAPSIAVATQVVILTARILAEVKLEVTTVSERIVFLKKAVVEYLPTAGQVTAAGPRAGGPGRTPGCVVVGKSGALWFFAGCGLFGFPMIPAEGKPQRLLAHRLHIADTHTATKGVRDFVKGSMIYFSALTGDAAPGLERAILEGSIPLHDEIMPRGWKSTDVTNFLSVQQQWKDLLQAWASSFGMSESWTADLTKLMPKLKVLWSGSDNGLFFDAWDFMAAKANTNLRRVIERELQHQSVQDYVGTVAILHKIVPDNLVSLFDAQLDVVRTKRAVVLAVETGRKAEEQQRSELHIGFAQRTMDKRSVGFYDVDGFRSSKMASWQETEDADRAARERQRNSERKQRDVDDANELREKQRKAAGDGGKRKPFVTPPAAPKASFAKLQPKVAVAAPVGAGVGVGGSGGGNAGGGAPNAPGTGRRSRPHAPKFDKQCAYVGTEAGCNRGNACNFKHDGV